MLIQEQSPVTADEFWTLSQRDDVHQELINGVIYPVELNGWKHGHITSLLLMYIHRHVMQQNAGRVTAPGTGYRLAEETVLAPDIGFVQDERLPDGLPDGFIPLAPDLAVEVMSPGNSAGEMSRKVKLFFEHGTRLIWIVHPHDRQIDVYQPTDEGATVNFLGMDDTLTGGDVLPGFTLKISDLFT
jgi:Uma2 family endonuclease